MFVVGSASAQQTPASSYGEAVFVVSGRGYGHGVGMSQYGAYGQALAGRTYDQILAYYYTGTQIGKAGRKDVRVLLAEGRRAVTVSSTCPLHRGRCVGRDVHPAEGHADAARRPLPPGRYRPGRSGAAARPSTGQEGAARARRDASTAASSSSSRRAASCGSSTSLPLESYLQGVVAGEMPFGWPAEALKAQAVAARSYALASLLKGKPFDLYSDVRSQVYLGVAGEKPSTTKAVTDTAGEVVLYGGKVATTYYFSTSGGKTASAADVFGFSVPYLVSRPDPWDKASPYHRWGPVLLGARTVQAKLGADARVIDATGHGDSVGSAPLPHAPDRDRLGAGTRVARADGARPSLDVDDDRRAPARPADRRSRRLRLERASSAASAAGSAAPRLRIVARRNCVVVRLTAVAPDPTGAVSVDVKPLRTTRYRLEAEGGASPALLVQVAPRCQLNRPTAARAGRLHGHGQAEASRSARSRSSGGRASAWMLVGEATVDAAGAFRLELDARSPGTYRARISATAAFAAGTSPTLQVTG